MVGNVIARGNSFTCRTAYLWRCISGILHLPVPHIFRFRLDLLPIILLFGDFGRGRRKLQLNLAVEGGKFGLQLLQLVLLLPHLARYILQLRYLPFQHLILRLVLVDDGGDSLNRVEEVAGGGQRVSQRQMPVVVGVLVVPLTALSFNFDAIMRHC